MKSLSLKLVAAVTAWGLGSLALADEDQQYLGPANAAGSPCQESITVFQDVSRLGRRDGAAKNMTEKHAEMARSGWRFADMEVYVENGDLEGFFLTYTRSAPCAPGR